MSNLFEVSLIIAALADPIEVQSRRVKVTPACAIVLDLIVAAPSASRCCLSAWLRTQYEPYEPYAREAHDLAIAVEKRIQWLADSRAGVA